jgi:hypothetical protein
MTSILFPTPKINLILKTLSGIVSEILSHKKCLSLYLPNLTLLTYNALAALKT